MAGELESELRRALHRVNAGQNPEKHRPDYTPSARVHLLQADGGPVVPVPQAALSAATQKPRGAARNIVAVSLSVAVVGFAVHQIGEQWRNGGGGGGGGERTETRNPSVAAVAKPKDEARLHTGLAIQPLIDPTKPDELTTTEITQPARLVESPAAIGDRSVDAAATFRQEVQEAAEFFKRVDRAAALSAPAAESAPKPQAQAQPLSGAEENRLLERGNELMQRGDITAARLLFEHLANRDSALAAFALAQSFDAGFLHKAQVRGLAPNQELADRWYRRAAELGSRDALTRVNAPAR